MEESREPGETRETRELVRRLLDQGVRRSEIAKPLGLSKPTVTYHAKHLGFGSDERFARDYNWAEIQTAYESGLSMRQCKARFGFSSQAWYGAASRGAIVARPTAMPTAELFVAGRRRGRIYLKKRLLRDGLREERCEACGITDWRDTPLKLHFHHVNGDGLDNRLENLQLLCPNCHSQTPNYGGRGRRHETVEDDLAA